MSNETEKLTINLGVVELAQIDVCVEQGIYSNRSDFVRTAVRKALESHSKTIKRQLTPLTPGKKGWEKVIGIWKIEKSILEEWAVRNEKVSISIIGMLIISEDITVELFEKAVGKVVLRGKIVASDEIKAAIQKMNQAVNP